MNKLNSHSKSKMTKNELETIEKILDQENKDMILKDSMEKMMIADSDSNIVNKFKQHIFDSAVNSNVHRDGNLCRILFAVLTVENIPLEQVKLDNTEANHGIVAMEDSQFVNNFSGLASGIHSDASHVLLENMLFNGNNGSQYGCIHDENSNILDGTGLYINNSIFTANEASIGGCVAFEYNAPMRQ